MVTMGSVRFCEAQAKPQSGVGHHPCGETQPSFAGGCKVNTRTVHGVRTRLQRIAHTQVLGVDRWVACDREGHGRCGNGRAKRRGKAAIPGEKARGIAGLRGFEGLHCTALALLPTLRAAPSTPISARVGCVVDHTLARTAGSVPRALLSTACGAQQVLVGVSLLATPPAFSALPCSAVPVYAPCSSGRVLHHGHIVKWHRRRPHQCCTHPTASVVGSAG